MKKGFTIIEILVVFGIGSVLMAVVVSSQRGFSQRRVSDNAAETLMADLRQAQQQSLSGVKPAGAVCDTPNTLEGYEVRFTDVGYQTYAICSGGELEVDSQNWPENVDSTPLSSDTSVRFLSVGRGTNLTGNLPVNLCSFNTSKTVTVTPTGEISKIDSTCPSPPGPSSSAPSPSTPSVPTWTFCANENDFCNFTGTKQVRYGILGLYVIQTHTNGVDCENRIFGDPFYGIRKQCHYRDIPASPVNNIWTASGETYTTAAPTTGSRYYIDRDFTLSSVPSILSGGTMIKTANDDKQSTINPFMRFDIGQISTVYVVYDISQAGTPSWLTSWTNTGQTVGISGDNATMRVFSKQFSAGQVTLEPNRGNGDSSMYFVVVK